MIGTKRLVKESPVGQGKNERIAYEVLWGKIGTPANPVVTLLDNTGQDVSSTCLSGAASVDGDIVTTPLVISLIPTGRYRLVCQVEINGNTLESICEIVGEE